MNTRGIAQLQWRSAVPFSVPRSAGAAEQLLAGLLALCGLNTTKTLTKTCRVGVLAMGAWHAIAPVAIGLALVAIYCVRNMLTKRPIVLSALVNLVLCGAGLFGGGVLVVSSVVPSVRAAISNIELYLSIGGLAILYVSAKQMIDEMNAGHQPQSPRPIDEIDNAHR